MIGYNVDSGQAPRFALAGFAWRGHARRKGEACPAGKSSGSSAMARTELSGSGVLFLQGKPVIEF
jgi:hypothetical protein